MVSVIFRLQSITHILMEFMHEPSNMNINDNLLNDTSLKHKSTLNLKPVVKLIGKDIMEKKQEPMT